MWEQADAQHKSDAAKAEYEKMLAGHPLPAESQLACHSALWCAWGAEAFGFGSTGFYEFCALAGLDTKSGRLVDTEDRP
jgi:hypothetical protein